MDLLIELGKIVDDAREARKRPPNIELLYGWTREQWSWAIYWHTMNCKPLDASKLTIEDALDIQTAWRNAMNGEPPTWATMLFNRVSWNQKWRV